MTARGNLYMGFLKNKDGTEKEYLTTKRMESFTVRKEKNTVFLLNYQFENGKTYTINFFENSLYISEGIEGEEETTSTLILYDDGEVYSSKFEQVINEVNKEFQTILNELEELENENEEKNNPEEPPSNST